MPPDRCPHCHGERLSEEAMEEAIFPYIAECWLPDLKKISKAILSRFRLPEVELDFNKLGILLLMTLTGMWEKEAKNFWTGKHFQNKFKDEANQIAEIIIDKYKNGGLTHEKAKGGKP